jgi:hypothetical protein
MSGSQVISGSKVISRPGWIAGPHGGSFEVAAGRHWYTD